MSGELFFHLLNSAILTIVVSLFVLWRYKATVLSGMMRGGDDVLPLPAFQAREDAGSLADLRGLWQFEKRRQREIAIAYVSTAFACALPLTTSALYIGTAHDPTIYVQPSFVVKLALVYAFASAPMIMASLALTPLRALAGLTLLTATLTTFSTVAIAIEWVFRGFPRSWSLDTPADFLGFAFDQLRRFAVLAMVAWPRRLRAVAPITLAALLLFGFAPFIATRLTGGWTDPSSLALNWEFVLAALGMGAVAWMRLHQLARSYERKRFSDVQLLSRAWWLLLVCDCVLTQVAGEAPLKGIASAVTAGAISLLLFAPVNAFALSRTRRPGPPPARTLLVLRVFGHDARTQRLFDRIAARWRMFGPVMTIAAPDVAARTIGPGEYLRWLTGRVDELFVTSRAQLDARLEALDREPDPDGRYRTNAFCCRDNTWQATVVELMQLADAVVMDVRGLTEARHGSEFELQQLSRRFPARRLVLVADRTTERTVLEKVFGPDLAEVRLVEMKSSRDHESVFEALLTAAA